MGPADLGATPITHPFYRELRDILGPRHTSSPPATLDTLAEEPQQAPEQESTPEVSPAPRGPPLEPTPRAPEQEEEGDSSSTETGLQILLPSRSSSRVSALGVRRPWEWTYSCTIGRTGERRRGFSGPGNPSGAIAPGQPLSRRPTGPTAGKMADPAPDSDGPPQLLAIHRRQLEVAEQHLQVEQRHLHLQEQALAWPQEAWGGVHGHVQPPSRLPGPPCCAGRCCACPECSPCHTTRYSAHRCAVCRRPATCR
ncbi:uncharacterized protein LOC142019286 [Carettochelys insculpta]|uniref:uncharacterized protein LOC142019286 n=1 Tax=Carettochelys insculpta TaxID=44489 RepID=UPI003EB9250C